MTSSFAPDLFDGFASFWPSPDANYKGKSKSLKSRDYLNSPDQSHSAPSSPVSRRKTYYNRHEDTGRRPYKYAPTQTSFAPPPERQDLFKHRSYSSPSRSKSPEDSGSRSKSQNLDGSYNGKRSPNKSANGKRSSRRQRSFSADATGAFEILE